MFLPFELWHFQSLLYQPIMLLPMYRDQWQYSLPIVMPFHYWEWQQEIVENDSTTSPHSHLIVVLAEWLTQLFLRHYVLVRWHRISFKSDKNSIQISKKCIWLKWTYLVFSASRYEGFHIKCFQVDSSWKIKFPGRCIATHQRQNIQHQLYDTSSCHILTTFTIDFFPVAHNQL